LYFAKTTLTIVSYPILPHQVTNSLIMKNITTSCSQPASRTISFQCPSNILHRNPSPQNASLSLRWPSSKCIAARRFFVCNFAPILFNNCTRTSTIMFQPATSGSMSTTHSTFRIFQKAKVSQVVIHILTTPAYGIQYPVSKNLNRSKLACVIRYNCAAVPDTIAFHASIALSSATQNYSSCTLVHIKNIYTTF